MDWLDLPAVQGTLKSSPTPQFKSINSSVLSFLYSPTLMTTGKTIALTRWTFVGKVLSLLFKMLSRLVIIFLPRSKRLLISWLQSTSALILEPQRIKSATVSTVPPSIHHEVAMKWWDWMPWSLFSECWALSQPFHSALSLSSRLYRNCSIAVTWVISYHIPTTLCIITFALLIRRDLRCREVMWPHSHTTSNY